MWFQLAIICHTWLVCKWWSITYDHLIVWSSLVIQWETQCVEDIDVSIICCWCMHCCLELLHVKIIDTIRHNLLCILLVAIVGTRCWECGIWNGVDKGANVIIKLVSRLVVHSQVVASQLLLFNMFWLIVCLGCVHYFAVCYHLKSVSLPGQPVAIWSISETPTEQKNLIIIVKYCAYR